MRAPAKLPHRTRRGLEEEFRRFASPHIVLADRLVRAIQGLDARRAEFDVLFIYIPKRWARGYVGGPEEDFDLHDHLKAMTAARRLPDPTGARGQGPCIS